MNTWLYILDFILALVAGGVIYGLFTGFNYRKELSTGMFVLCMFSCMVSGYFIGVVFEAVFGK